MKRAFFASSVCRLRLVVTLNVILLQFSALLADDWPQWRGPNRDGSWHETGLLQSFPASGLKVQWRLPVGWGFSSPVVARGRVYLTDSVVAKPNARERVRCFDELTGEALWIHGYDVAYEDWAFDPTQEVGPLTTPIVKDGRIYAIGRRGDLFCLDAQKGNVLWERHLQKDYQAGSPLIEGDLLILFLGEKPNGCLVALNKDTGMEAWRALDEQVTHSSPIVITSGGRRQLIVWTQESVTSLDPVTGSPFWRQRLLTNDDYAVSTPVFHNDRLLIGGLMLQLEPDKPAARIRWPTSKAPARRVYSNTSTALLQGEYLYSARSTGELICVEASSGREIWQSTNVTDLKNGASIHLTPNGDSVLLYTNKGELIRARLTPERYHELGRAKVLEPTFPFAGRNVAWSPPAYANHRLFVRNGHELLCVSLAAVP